MAWPQASSSRENRFLLGVFEGLHLPWLRHLKAGSPCELKEAGRAAAAAGGAAPKPKAPRKAAAADYAEDFEAAMEEAGTAPARAPAPAPGLPDDEVPDTFTCN
nr:hypothetical protein [Candidatus Sigynarchaeum springense]